MDHRFVHRLSLKQKGDIPKDSGIHVNISNLLKWSLKLFLIVYLLKGLKSMDSNGLADPYVKLHLLPGASKVNIWMCRADLTVLQQKVPTGNILKSYI